jgi:hypothetical protein
MFKGSNTDLREDLTSYDDDDDKIKDYKWKIYQSMSIPDASDEFIHRTKTLKEAMEYTIEAAKDNIKAGKALNDDEEIYKFPDYLLNVEHPNEELNLLELYKIPDENTKNIVIKLIYNAYDDDYKSYAIRNGYNALIFHKTNLNYKDINNMS